MINTLFCDIADKLKLTGFFDSVYEYCEIIQRTDGTLRPMYYKGLKAGYIDVQNFDKNGSAYIRKRGTTTVRPDTSAIRLNSCVDTSKNIIATFPLRLVVAVPKTQLDDSPMVDDNLAAELIGTLQGDMEATALAMNATSVSLQVTSYDTDAVTIWNAENKGVTLDETKVYRFSYLAIDFICEIRGQVECLKTCQPNEY